MFFCLLYLDWDNCSFILLEKEVQIYTDDDIMMCWVYI